jgi:serine/threonine-protein kinase HipA
LPEGHLRQYLAERGEVHPDREFFLLWLLGEDLPGALRVRPAEGDVLPPAYAREAAAEFDGARADPGTSHALRFSPAGIHLKFSAITKRSGPLTIPAKGVGGSRIVELPSERYDGVPRNEYSMVILASRLGMNVPLTAEVPVYPTYDFQLSAGAGAIPLTDWALSTTSCGRDRRRRWDFLQ